MVKQLFVDESHRQAESGPDGLGLRGGEDTGIPGPLHPWRAVCEEIFIGFGFFKKGKL